MIFVYTTCRDIEEAKKIGKLIIERRLAACVDMWPIKSMYFWEGEFKESEEAILLVKTSEVKLQEIEFLIQSNHSYNVPCIAAIDVKRINPAYKEWMIRSIG